MNRLYFEKTNEDTIYCLIIYDISDDKRRTKLAKILEGFGYRVQMSAFEFWISQKDYKRMMEKIEKIKDKDDNIRVYYLNKADYSRHDKFSERTNNARCDVCIA